MGLRYCQKQGAATDAIKALIMHQGSWVDLNQEYQNALMFLQENNFARSHSSCFVKCYNHRDVEDLKFVSNHDCHNQIYIEPDFDEDCDDLVCDSCGRYILPNTHSKQRFVETSVELNYKVFEKFIEDSMHQQEIAFHRLSKGIYAAMSPHGLATIVVMDLCDDYRYLTVDKLKASPTLLLNIRDKLPKTGLEVQRLSVADFVVMPEILADSIMATCKQGVADNLPNQSASVLPFPSINLAESKPAIEEKYLEIKINDAGVSINDIVVVGRQASSRLLIFRLLLEQYWQDFEVAKPSEQHSFLNMNQLSDLMEPHVGMISDLEQQIRRPLNKMQKVIQEILARNLGLPVQRHDVIETRGWPGCNNKQEFGYRLNPNTLLFRK